MFIHDPKDGILTEKDAFINMNDVSIIYQPALVLLFFVFKAF